MKRLKKIPHIPVTSLRSFDQGFSFLTKQKFSIIILLFITLVVLPGKLHAQEKSKVELTDSTKVHSAKKATLMSMALPGLGQAYNKKYWKIPVIYVGFGVLYYFIKTNGTEYHNFREAYDIVATNDTVNFDNEYAMKYNYNLALLEEGRNYYRRNFELSLIITGLLYVLNIVDASVDANLYSFDINDDVSLRFEPMSDQYFSYKPVPAIGLRYRF